jgi:hypothetical protein
MFAYNQVLEGRGMKRSKPARSQTKKIGKDENPLPPVTEDYISSLRGCCRGEDSLVQAREREHREESFAERRWNRRAR